MLCWWPPDQGTLTGRKPSWEIWWNIKKRSWSRKVFLNGGRERVHRLSRNIECKPWFGTLKTLTAILRDSVYKYNHKCSTNSLISKNYLKRLLKWKRQKTASIPSLSTHTLQNPLSRTLLLMPSQTPSRKLTVEQKCLLASRKTLSKVFSFPLTLTLTTLIKTKKAYHSGRELFSRKNLKNRNNLWTSSLKRHIQLIIFQK